MSKEITMPKLSDTMTEGLFAGWKKSIGDRIERGDIIAEVETDKAVMELEAFASGILIKTMVNGGENVPVGTVLGLIGETGESVDTIEPIPPSAETMTTISQATEKPVSTSEVTIPVASTTEIPHDKASPMVRRLARDLDIDLDQIKGSGPEGRITQEDLNTFARQQQGKTESGTPTTTPPTEAPAEGSVPASMREAIANSVTVSWQTIPHFPVTVEINMDECREIISELKEGPTPVGYNAFVIKACAITLLKFPLLCSINPSTSSDINISFAVSKNDGLMMPVIRKCQSLSVVGIENEVSRLAAKCGSGRLTSEELSGGAFSISNLGMYGVDEFAALILPGQTAILAIGAVRQRPVVQNGQLAAAATMRVTLSSDHRIIYGAYAASFLAELRAILEKPVSLLM